MPTGEKIEFRQSVPPIFDVTTVCYVVSPDFLRQAEGIFEGRVGVVEVPPERALDIDTEMDFHIARALIGAVKK
jgi:N-acylneuraminate cytidylyltransferase